MVSVLFSDRMVCLTHGARGYLTPNMSLMSVKMDDRGAIPGKVSSEPSNLEYKSHFKVFFLRGGWKKVLN